MVVRVNAARKLVNETFGGIDAQINLDEYDSKQGSLGKSANDDEQFTNLVKYVIHVMQAMICAKSTSGGRYEHMRNIVEDFMTKFVNNVNQFGALNSDQQDWCFISLGYYLLLPKSAVNISTRNKIWPLALELVGNPIDYMESYPERAIAMMGPWLLATYYKMRNVKDYEKLIEKDPTYVAITEFLRMDIVRHPYHIGLHADCTYYDSMQSFRIDLLREFTAPVILYVYRLPNHVRHTPANAWDKIDEILSHPTITAGIPGVNLVENHSTIHTHTNPKAPMGLKVVSSLKYLRWNDEIIKYAVLMTNSKVPFFDSMLMDLNMDLVQYRLQRRYPDTVKTTFIPNSREPGFIISGTKPMQIPVSERVCKYAKEARSVVLVYKHVGVAYQEYYIPELGEYHVREVVVIDTAARTIRVTIEIKNHGDTELYYVPNYNDHIGIPPKETVTISTFNNLREVNVDVSTNNHEVKLEPMINLTKDLTFRYNVGEHREAAVIFENNHPKVCDFMETRGTRKEVTVNLFVGKTKFAFDEDKGVWVVSHS